MSSVPAASPAAPGVLRRSILPSAACPRTRRFGGGAAAAAGVVVPGCLTASVLRVLDGRADAALLLPVVLLAACVAAAWLRWQRVAVLPTADGFRDLRMLGRARSVPRTAIASAVLVRMLCAGAPRTSRWLFVRDASGRTLLRLHEDEVGPAALDSAIAHLAEPPVEVHEPLTFDEVRGRRVVRLPWWERSPLLRTAALCVAVPVAAVVLLVPLFAL